MTLNVGCICGARWTGTRIAHCRSADCHRTFSTATNFDRHWRGKGDNRHCVDPATVGLVPREHPGCVIWSRPREDVAGRPERSGGSRDTGNAGSVAQGGTAAAGTGIQEPVLARAKRDVDEMFRTAFGHGP